MSDAAPSAVAAIIAELERRVGERPQDARLRFQLGEQLLVQGDVAAALTSFQRAAELAPQVSAAHFGLANAYYACEQFAAAADSYAAAFQLDPDAATANNRGNALARAGRAADAEACFTAALRLDPEFVPALVNVGRCRLAQGDAAGAVPQLENAVRQAPQRRDVLMLLGDALQMLGRLDEAAARYVQAAAISDQDAALFHRLGDLNSRRGQLTEAQFCYAKALELEPRSAATHSALIEALQNDSGVTAEQRASEARYWAQCHAAAVAERAMLQAVDAERRLRIGYVSPDFGSGVIGRTVEAVLRHHNRATFEAVCYSLRPDEDEQTAAIRSAADRFAAVAELAPEQLSQQIRSDGIDILIDLAGHRPGNRLQAFAGRPAPLQVAWLGYPETTGLDAIDYVLVDRMQVRPEDERLFTERIVCLDGGFACFASLESAADSLPPLSASREGAVFAAFCDLAKISPSVVQLWSTLLLSDPSFTLLLKTPALGDQGVQNRIAALFTEQQVPRDQLRLEGTATAGETPTTYTDVDAVLDTFPHDGGLDLGEWLRRGVPVVHLCGSGPAGRRGDSILQNLGLPEFIAGTRDEYLEIAKACAAKRADTTLRNRLRTQVLTSTWSNVAGFTERLEATLRRLWLKRCTNEA